MRGNGSGTIHPIKVRPESEARSAADLGGILSVGPHSGNPPSHAIQVSENQSPGRSANAHLAEGESPVHHQGREKENYRQTSRNNMTDESTERQNADSARIRGLRSTENLSKDALGSTRTDFSGVETVPMHRFSNRFTSHPLMEAEYGKHYLNVNKKFIYYAVKVLPLFMILYYGTFYETYNEKMNTRNFEAKEYALIACSFSAIPVILSVATMVFNVPGKYIVIFLNLSIMSSLMGFMVVESYKNDHFPNDTGELGGFCTTNYNSTKHLARDTTVTLDSINLQDIKNITIENTRVYLGTDDILYIFDSKCKDGDHAHHIEMLKGKDSYAFCLLATIVLFGSLQQIFRLPYTSVFAQGCILIISNITMTLATKNYATIQRSFLFLAMLSTGVICFANSARNADKVARRTFLNERELRRRNEILRQKLENMRNIKKKAYDLDSPIEMAFDIIKKWRDNPEVYSMIGNDLDGLSAILSDTNIFNPDFKKKMEGSSTEVDKEVKDWILYEFAQTNRDNLTRTMSSRSMHERSVSFSTVPTNIGQKNEKGEGIIDKTEWNTPIFELCKVTNDHPLKFSLDYLMKKHGLLQKFKIPEPAWSNFLGELEKGYGQNPFHNQIHVADVTLNINYLIHRPTFAHNMTDLDKLACFLAAASHDFRHPGVNNIFCINTEKPESIIYNDRSVLENFHISQFFQLITDPTKNCNIFCNLDRADRKEVRETMIEMVMATDMSQHFAILNQFKTLSQSADFDLSKRASKLMFLKIAIKCADIGHTTKVLDLHKVWTINVAEEFFNQGDLEKASNIPVSPFMDRTVRNIPNSQLGFLDYVCRPLFEVWGGICNADMEMVEQLDRNHAYWKSRRDEGFVE